MLTFTKVIVRTYPHKTDVHYLSKLSNEDKNRWTKNIGSAMTFVDDGSLYVNTYWSRCIGLNRQRGNYLSPNYHYKLLED